MKILNLHGNNIHNLSSVSILKDLPKLITLTLHGNPIDSIPQYRSHIVNMLPQIINLDFSPVVESEHKGELLNRIYKANKIFQARIIKNNQDYVNLEKS